MQNLTVTGNGTAQTIAALAIASGVASIANAASIRAVWVQISSEGTGTTRVGDAHCDATHGLPVPGGAGQFLPVKDQGGVYSLQGVYVYIPNGDVVQIAWES